MFDQGQLMKDQQPLILSIVKNLFFVMQRGRFRNVSSKKKILQIIALYHAIIMLKVYLFRLIKKINRVSKKILTMRSVFIG